APALKMIRLLRERGADVSYHDPHVSTLPEFGLTSIPLDEALAGADLACIVTAHPEVAYERVVAEAPLVLDLRGVTRGIEAPHLVRLSLRASLTTMRGAASPLERVKRAAR